LQFLIQAQIDEINAQSDLSKESKRLRYNLRKQLIAVENQKQNSLDSDDEKEKSLIEAKLKAQDEQLAGLRGALLENAALEKNAKIGSLRKMISHAESTA